VAHKDPVVRAAYFKAYAEKNRERKRAYRRKCEARPEYKAQRKVYMQKWAAANRDKILANRKKWASHHNARQIFKDAIKAGKLKKQPCEKCGNTRVEGHHSDYSKPLDVQWLCRDHHSAARRVS
jgi:hypothetical protein